jgi:hypothetical protein
VAIDGDSSMPGRRVAEISRACFCLTASFQQPDQLGCCDVNLSEVSGAHFSDEVRVGNLSRLRGRNEHLEDVQRQERGEEVEG